MRKYDGFTLIEMLLAMSFVSGLLLAIALLIINITNVYTKGVTLTATDRAGKVIIADIRKSLGEASPAGVAFVSVMSGPTKIGGRLCTGSVSYVWNYGDTISKASTQLIYRTHQNRYTTGAVNSASTYNIRFQKYSDTTGSICKTVAGLYPRLVKANAIELLSESDRQVVVHNFTFSRLPFSSSQEVYKLSMTIGTNNSDESDVIGGTRSCKPPSEGYYEFCSVNVFDYTVRSGNNGG